MRFLCISLGLHPDLIGGAWKVAAEQCAGLAARGHAVEVITAQPETRLPQTEVRDDVRIHRYPVTQGSFHTRWRAANRAARELVLARLAASPEPTLVLQHHAYLGPATRNLTTPILHVFHGPWAEEYRIAIRARPRSLLRRTLDLLLPRILHRVESESLARSRRILVLSRHFETRLHHWHPGRLPPVHVVPGGVDFRRFHPPADRPALRAELGIPPDNVLCVAIRRLDPRMGLNLLVEGFASLAGSMPHARLWITGRGEAEADLQRQITRLGLGDRIRLLGFVPDPEVPRLLGAADVTVMPSLDLEGFGLATAESLACGTPVLGSRAGATPELLEPLDPNLLFEQGSAHDLTLRLAKALRHPDHLPSRERCSAHARQHFTWDHQVHACEAAGEAFLQARPPE